MVNLLLRSIGINLSAIFKGEVGSFVGVFEGIILPNEFFHIICRQQASAIIDEFIARYFYVFMIIIFSVKGFARLYLDNVLAPVPFCKAAVIKGIIKDLHVLCATCFKPEFSVAFKQNCNKYFISVVVKLCRILRRFRLKFPPVTYTNDNDNHDKTDERAWN